MIIAQPSRPKIKRQRKQSPHVVQTTTPSVTVTSVDTQVLYPSDQVLPAFYVSPTGSDSGEGTEADPFETLEAARDAMRGSGTISRTYLRGGTYNVTSALLLNTNDINTEWLSYPTETPIIDGGGNNIRLFRGQGGANITIKGITFQNLSGSSDGDAAIRMNTDSTGWLIEDCIFTNVYDGIAIGDGVDDQTILTNEFTNLGNRGVYCFDGGTDNITIAGNYFHDIETQQFNRCISIGQVTNSTVEYNWAENISGPLCTITTLSAASGNVVRYNIAKKCCSQQGDYGAIYTLERTQNGLNTGILISDNWIDNVIGEAGVFGAYGIYLDDASSGMTITNNVVMGVTLSCFYNHGGKTNTCDNNVFGLSVADCVQGAFKQEDSGHAIGTPDEMEDNTFQSNIILPITSNTDLSLADWSSGNVFSEGNADPDTYGIVYIDPSESNRNAPPTVGDNIRGTGVERLQAQNVGDTDFLETAASSPQIDSTDEATYYDSYDPDNFVIDLAASHPAYSHSFTDIVGVTDGGTFFWGAPSQNANSGYDRDDYV